MQFEDEFCHIGADLLEKVPEQRYTKEEILKRQDEKLKDIRRSTPIIMLEPDPDFEKPKEEFSNYSKESLFYNATNLEKKLKDLFLSCFNLLKDTDKTLTSTYETHKIDANKRKCIDILFRKAQMSIGSHVHTKYSYHELTYNFDNLVKMFEGVRKSLLLIDIAKENTLFDAISILGNEYLSIIDKELRTSLVAFSQTNNNELFIDLKNIVDYDMRHGKSVIELLLSKLIAKEFKDDKKHYIGEIINSTKYVDDFTKFQQNMITSYQKFKLKTKAHMYNFTEEGYNDFLSYGDKITIVLNFIHIYTLAICTIATNLNMDFQNIMLLIEPTDYKFKTNRLIDKIEKVPVMLSSDYHLLRELLKGPTNDISRSEEIIQMHNKYVKPNDLFVFLGDITEAEYLETNSKYKKYLPKIIELCNKLNGKKILLTGNNDTLNDDFYKECGFIEIIREPVLLNNHVFSHEPIDTENGILNVHGHIHGSKCYHDGIDWDWHIDVYYGIYGHPVSLKFLDKYFESGKYKPGCKTE